LFPYITKTNSAASELYRILAPRVDLLRGLLGADLIGFHTWDYVRHFLSTVTRILGIECTHRGTSPLKEKLLLSD
jgi:trehalose-6-phosphate synthase